MNGDVMNWRMNLADWISGGAITRAQAGQAFAIHVAVDRHNLAVDRHVALNRIISCETPKANATVKRMAKIARGAKE